MPRSACPKDIPLFSGKQKVASAATGVTRCMKKSETDPSSTFAHPSPILGARKKNTVSIVTVTAAVPIYFSSHIHYGMSPVRDAIPVRRQAAAQSTLL